MASELGRGQSRGALVSPLVLSVAEADTHSPATTELTQCVCAYVGYGWASFPRTQRTATSPSGPTCLLSHR